MLLPTAIGQRLLGTWGDLPIELDDISWQNDNTFGGTVLFAP
jgi:hypothetical protein